MPGLGLVLERSKLHSRRDCVMESKHKQRSDGIVAGVWWKGQRHCRMGNRVKGVFSISWASGIAIPWVGTRPIAK